MFQHSFSAQRWSWVKMLNVVEPNDKMKLSMYSVDTSLNTDLNITIEEPTRVMDGDNSSARVCLLTSKFV